MPAPDPFGQRPLYVDPATGRTSRSALALRPRGLDPAVAAAVLAGQLDPGRSLFLGLARVAPARGLVSERGPGSERGPVSDRRHPEPSRPARGRRISRTVKPGRSFVAGSDGAPQDDGGGSAAWTGDDLLDALERAVLDVAPPGPVDLSLSGGLDSALLAALLARASRAGRAFTLCVDYDASGEATRAAALCARLGLEQVHVPVGEHELPERFEDAVRAAEAPLWNGRAVASLLFFERCRVAGASALVSGCGADDVLCGQPEALRSRPARAALERRLAESVLLPGACETLPADAGLPGDRETLPTDAGLPGARETLPTDAGPPGSLLEAQERWLESGLPESTLVPECRLSAAAGVDVRLPYLGAAFAPLALALPEGQRVRDGWGKWLLRRAAEPLLPYELCWQPKQPRLAPAGGRSAHARRAWGERLAAWLTSERLEALQIVEPQAARALFERQAGGNLAPEESAATDALLLRLAGLTILQCLAHNPHREA